MKKPDLISPWFPEPDLLVHQALGKACEEASELASALARSLIQGLDEQHPVTGTYNRHAVADELADVAAVTLWLGEIAGVAVDKERVQRKLEGFRRWQGMLGADDVPRICPNTGLKCLPQCAADGRSRAGLHTPLNEWPTE